MTDEAVDLVEKAVLAEATPTTSITSTGPMASSAASVWRCTLCGGGENAVVGRIKVKDVIREYKRQFKVLLEYPGFSETELRECSRCGLISFSPPWIGGEALYAQLGALPWYYLAEKEEYRIAARWIDPAASVLEIGAGTGQFAQRLSLTNYEGLELNENAARIAREAGRNVHAQSIHDYAREHPSARDCICLFQVLEHVADIRGMMEDCIAALQPGGGLIVSVPNHAGFMGVEKNNPLNAPPHHATRWDRRALEYLGKSLDLKVLEIAEEELADVHIPNYARCLTSGVLEKRLHLKLRPLHPWLGSRAWRGMAVLMASATEAGLRREPKLRPRGHSIVGVFGKR